MVPYFLDQQELTPEERVIREAFVRSYFEDFDVLKACLRIGMTIETAQKYSSQFMTESYVQKLIAERMRDSKHVLQEEEIESDRALVINALRQAAQNGPYASRVTAASRLAEMRGFTTTDADDPARKLVDAFREVAGIVK